MQLNLLLEEEKRVKESEVWRDGYNEGEAQAKEIVIEEGKEGAPLEGKELVYSQVLESGKEYEVKGGVLSIVVLKFVEGIGTFNITISRNQEICLFTVVPDKEYLLLPQALVFPGGGSFEVKEIKGHIRYVCAMSSFLNSEIKEMK